MLWPAHRTAQPQKISHHGNVPEGNSGLRHAEWPRIHPKQQNLLGRLAKASEIRLVQFPGIVERAIDKGDRLGKGKFTDATRQGATDGNQRFFLRSFHVFVSLMGRPILVADHAIHKIPPFSPLPSAYNVCLISLPT